jgi:hypothetical protein
MKRFAAVFVVIAAALVLGACAHEGGTHQGMNKGAGAAGTAKGTSVIYWCACGPECTCNSVSTKPGTCSCGKEMAGGHVVFMEGTTALACTCGPACTCAIDPKDHTKCGCGKPIKRINLEGTGLYFCNCGGSCGCNTVSDKPGACTCGMPLHQAK